MLLKHSTLSALILLVLFSSCGSTKDIVVKLSPTYGLHREMGQTNWGTRHMAKDSVYTTYAKQLGLENFIVTQFLHRPWEHYYFEWKEGKRDSSSYRTSLTKFNDSSLLPDSFPKLDGESIFLFGQKSTGEYLLIADENNNNTLRDDSIRVVTPVTGRAADTPDPHMPTVRIYNLQGFYNGNINSFSTTVNLRPKVIIDSTNSRNINYYLDIISSESFAGDFRYKGRKYKVATRSVLYPLLSNKQDHIIVKFAEGKEDSAFLMRWNTRAEYRKGDTVAMKKHVFTVKSLSPLMTDITLHPLKMAPGAIKPKSTDPRMEAIVAGRRWEGRPYPSFAIKNRDTLLTNERLKGKVVFINFWFAVCPPCIAEFEALSQMYDRLKDSTHFEFVSLTFESPEVIERVKQKYHLTFPIYSISEEECERLNFGNGYPTNIIVDKKGIIQFLHVGGETSAREAKAFIDKEIYTKILQEL